MDCQFAMKCGAAVGAPLRMNPNPSGDPFDFSSSATARWKSEPAYTKNNTCLVLALSLWACDISI